MCILCAVDPSPKQSYSRINDEQSSRASHVVQHSNDLSPMRNGDGEAGDESRRGSVCKWHKLHNKSSVGMLLELYRFCFHPPVNLMFVWSDCMLMACHRVSE